MQDLLRKIATLRWGFMRKENNLLHSILYYQWNHAEMFFYFYFCNLIVRWGCIEEEEGGCNFRQIDSLMRVLTNSNSWILILRSSIGEVNSSWVSEEAVLHLNCVNRPSWDTKTLISGFCQKVKEFLKYTCVLYEDMKKY